jgi:hypothetical protein
MQEQIIETKNCKQCGSSFDITEKDIEFYDKISPIFADKKYNIPTPKLCPECRQQRRFCFSNERNFYKNQSSKSEKNLISIYSQDKNINVMEQGEWWKGDFD